LSVADIDGVDGRGAVLEEAVGEAAGGGAEIEGAGARDGDGEVEEGVLELVAAPRDEAFGAASSIRASALRVSPGFPAGCPLTRT